MSKQLVHLKREGDAVAVENFDDFRQQRATMKDK